jgi:hypothetical protein
MRLSQAASVRARRGTAKLAAIVRTAGNASNKPLVIRFALK